MQINPNYLSQLTSRLSQITATEQQLAGEISSGARVSALAQDPGAVAQNVTLNAAIEQADSYDQTAHTVTGKLQVADSTLSLVVSQLTQAISTTTLGNNGVNTAQGQATVATQLAGIRDEVLSLANTSYLGSYLFSGSSSAAPFSLDTTVDPAVVHYNGDSIQSSLSSPQGGSIPINKPGDQIFTASTVSVFGTLNQLISDFTSGNTNAAISTAASLNSALTLVTQQRASLDSSISRISMQDTGFQQQSTQMLVQQTNLMQADTASVATALSSSETQQTALQDTIAALEKQGNLFDLLH